MNKLPQRHIHFKNSTRKNIVPFIGDVALIKDETHIPRDQWRLDKVDEVIFGRNGSIRGVELAFISKIDFRTIYYRPIQKIIPFEINEATKGETRERCSANTEPQITGK